MHGEEWDRETHRGGGYISRKEETSIYSFITSGSILTSGSLY